MPIDAVRLSKAMAHALRHAPWQYELELDAEGWVPADDLLTALRERGGTWAALTPEDLGRVIDRSDKARYELRDGRIRARYGHSVGGRLARAPAEPPPTLYHGTSPAALPAIQREGLRPMRRQYVHLSTDPATARQVGARRSPRPVVLAVRAAEAHAAGLPFYLGNAHVWLADRLPPTYLDVESD